MPEFARLIKCLLALLFITAMATLDLRPQVDPLTASVEQSFGPELEDGPEGEKAPIATFVRSYDGDDQLRSDVLGGRSSVVRYAVLAADAARDPPAPSHSPCAGLPTGPPCS